MSRDTRLQLIDPDPEQPRKVFDEASLQELAQSMATTGLAVPILLRPAPEGRYRIVHGERRWRAAQRLGWETIPAEVRELTADEAHWLSLVENVQRAELSPIEEARAYQGRLAQGLTQAQLAQRVGKDRSYIAQKLRLLTLPAAVLVYLEHRALTEGHARQLLKLRQWLGEDTMQCIGGPRTPIEGEPPLVTAALNAWDEELGAGGGTMPSWEAAASAWATWALSHAWSVAELAAKLEAFYLNVCVAACCFNQWLAGHRLMPDDPEEERQLFREMWELLNFAGWLHLVLQGTFPAELLRHAYARVAAC